MIGSYLLLPFFCFEDALNLLRTGSCADCSNVSLSPTPIRYSEFGSSSSAVIERNRLFQIFFRQLLATVTTVILAAIMIPFTQHILHHS